MRILHLIFLVFFSALILAIAQEETGRVALVVFFTGLCEFFFGLIGLMSLFKTVAMIGYAGTVREYFQAITATTVVLVVATATMNAVLWLGLFILQMVVPE
ncbi:MAG TPA: hypothetical protein VGZ22_27985 [Isosphaeraceae bacterium]|jgi:hypothetical protein|nr:hypothetical protein [Isosphaeraceae bacterium]